MDELKDKFHDAIIGEKTGKLLNGLSKYSRLIIDEVEYCKFNRQETLLFFQLVDRVSIKETGSIVLLATKIFLNGRLYLMKKMPSSAISIGYGIRLSV